MTLTAITPNDTTRYAGRQTSTLSHTVIPGILDSQTVETELPQYLPVQWSAHIHPEGQRYFYRKAEPLASSDFDVVTEANMYCEETATQVLSTIKEVQDRISTSNVKLPNGAELLLQAMDEDGCGYYFADHGLRRLFWLETLDTETLGLSAVASASHLEQCLTSMYWCHVEYFPMHRSTVDVAFVDEITAVLSHAHLDILTSATSTFPFSIEKCNQLAKLLRNSRGQTSDGHVAWMTARVAALIYEHRISIQFGESTARLGLDQSLFPEPNFEDSRMNKILSCLTFSGSNLYMSRLNSLFIDRTVYTRQWKPFWARSLKEWKNISAISIALLLLHVLLGYVGGAIPGLVIASGTFVGLSTLSSLLLSLQHTDKEEESISRSHSYLEQARSETSGFTSTAFLFALPKASLLWGLLFFTVNWVAILIHYTPFNFAPAPLLCISAFAITSVALLRIRKLWRILSFRRFYSKADDCSDLV